MDIKIDIEDFKKILYSKDEFVIIDMRFEEEIKQQGRFIESLEIEETELPDHAYQIPAYFRDNVCVFVGSTPDAPLKYMEKWISEDSSLTKAFCLMEDVSTIFKEFPDLLLDSK